MQQGWKLCTRQLGPFNLNSTCLDILSMLNRIIFSRSGSRMADVRHTNLYYCRFYSRHGCDKRPNGMTFVSAICWYSYFCHQLTAISHIYSYLKRSVSSTNVYALRKRTLHFRRRMTSASSAASNPYVTIVPTTSVQSKYFMKLHIQWMI